MPRLVAAQLSHDEFHAIKSQRTLKVWMMSSILLICAFAQLQGYKLSIAIYDMRIAFLLL